VISAVLLLALAHPPTALSACAAPPVPARIDLDRARWRPEVRDTLLKTIRRHAVGTPGYDRCRRPLVVLGWEGVLVRGRPADRALGLAQSRGWLEPAPDTRLSKRLAAIAVGRTRDDLAGLAAELAGDLVTPPEIVALLATLTAAGWDILVVSSAPGWLVRPHTATLGIAANQVVALDNRFDPGGKGTESVVPPIPVGRRKIEAVRTGAAPGGRIPNLALGTLKDAALLADARTAIVFGTPAPTGRAWPSQPSFD